MMDGATYPNAPGWKDAGTARDAARAVAPTANVLRDRCLRSIEAAPNGLTPHELAELLDWDVCSIRPRITELSRLGKVRKAGRRPTPSGCSSYVWAATFC